MSNIDFLLVIGRNDPIVIIVTICPVEARICDLLNLVASGHK